MIELSRAIAGIALFWTAGYFCVRALRRWGRTNAAVEWGYGHFAGILLLTLTMRVAGLVGLPLTLTALVPAFALVVGATLAALHFATRRSPAVMDAPTSVADRDTAPLVMAGIFAALIALRLGTLGIDATLRPLYPWDAWTQWATKAKVWSQLHALVPFVTPAEWIARVAGYTDNAPQYPATIPLLQAWMALCVGSWNDALINLPWLAAAIALGLGIYGQLRALRVSPPWAMAAVYATLSLPLLDTHVALAGYADLHVAAAFGLAITAMIAWERDRLRTQLALALTLAALLPLLKVPGVVWSGIVVMGLLVAAYGVSWKRAAAIGGVTGSIALAVAALLWREKIAAVTTNVSEGVVGSLVQNMFLFDNWHLLWYLLPIALLLGRREAVTRMRGATVALACGGAFLVAIFLGTRVSTWVTDYTTVNRALLHIAPAATVAGALLVWYWALGHDDAAPAEAALPATALPEQTVEVGDGAGQPVAQFDGGRPAE